MRTLLIYLIPLCAALAQNPFDKPPADVDDALRARVTQFYQYHVDNKYRLAEPLVAEESKDGFYAANKPELKSFHLGDIAYSENYTKAKVTIVSKMEIVFLGMAAPKVMDVPFPSYWKIDNGQWCWYIFNDPHRATPFGQVVNPPKEGEKADPSLSFKGPDLQSIMNQVKADRTAVKLDKKAGSEDRITISNGMPGAVKLVASSRSFAGFDMDLDKQDLKAGEKSVVTFRAKEPGTYSNVPVRIVIEPINQVIDIQVSFR